jgi:hypothetical protein
MKRTWTDGPAADALFFWLFAAATALVLALLVIGVALADEPARADDGPHGSASGTVASIESGTFVLATADGGTMRIATTPTTGFSRTVSARLADATVGSTVTVTGTIAANRTIAATSIEIVPGARSMGSISANDGDSLTITTPRGPVRVTTSPDTVITATTDASDADLSVLDAVQIDGTGDDGLVVADAIHIVGTGTMSR